MTTINTELPAWLDIRLKRGADLTVQWTWYAGGVGVDFTNATGRIMIADACGNESPLITTTPSSYGVVVLGTAGAGTSGTGSFTFAKPVTQILPNARQTYDFYVDWPDGTSTCVLTGTLSLLPGSPY